MDSGPFRCLLKSSRRAGGTVTVSPLLIFFFLLEPAHLLGGTGTLLERAGESACARVRFVDPGPSDLYGNITTFGERGLLEARSERAINTRVIWRKKGASFNLTERFTLTLWRFCRIMRGADRSRMAADVLVEAWPV